MDLMKRLFFLATWILVIGATLFANDPTPWKRDLKRSRTYYPNLSNSEYKALTPGPCFYPFFIDHWRQGPIVNDHFKYDVPKTALDVDVKLQAKVFETYKDVRLLGRTISELGRAGNVSAVPILKAALKTVEDLNLQRDCLRTLAAMKASFSKAELETLLASKSPTVQMGAAELYAVQTFAEPGTLLNMAKTATGHHRLSLIGWAASCKNAGHVALWQPFLENEEEATKAIPGVLRADGVGLAKILTTLSARPSVALRFALVVNCGHVSKSQRMTLLKTHSRDAHSSIRAQVAHAIGESRDDDALSELLALAVDEFVSVRLESAMALGVFPGQKTFAALTTLTGDASSFLVRDAARDSMIAIAKTFDVDAAIGANVKSSDPFVRLNAYRVAYALKSTRHGAALTQSVPREKAPENLADGIRAWVLAVGDKSRSFIARQSGHESVLVRIAVAEAIGRQRWKQHYRILRKDMSKKVEVELRQAALTAMGRTRDATFAKDILAILKQTKAGAEVTSDNRAAACWAVSMLTKPPNFLVERVFKHVVQPLVIAPGAPPSYEEDQVRVAATMTLALLAKRGIADTANLAEVTLDRLRVDAETAQRLKGMPSGPHLECYADQIEAYCEGKAVGATARKPLTFYFGFRTANRR